MSDLNFECSSCGRLISSRRVEELEEGGVLCENCSSDRLNQDEIEATITNLLRHHVAFGETKDGQPYVMIGGKKIEDPSIVSQFEGLYSLFWD